MRIYEIPNFKKEHVSLVKDCVDHSSIAFTRNHKLVAILLNLEDESPELTLGELIKNTQEQIVNTQEQIVQ